MKVKELIEILEQVEDKDKDIFLCINTKENRIGENIQKDMIDFWEDNDFNIEYDFTL